MIDDHWEFPFLEIGDLMVSEDGLLHPDTACMHNQRNETRK